MNGLVPADPIKMNEQKLTKTKKILPQEWIQDYFNPVVGVLSTPDVNALCHKNNLSMGPVFSMKLTQNLSPESSEWDNNHCCKKLSKFTQWQLHKVWLVNEGSVGSSQEAPMGAS